MFKIKIINKNNVAEERNILLKNIEYLSDLKANRFIAVDGKCYRLTAKSYTELKKKIA